MKPPATGQYISIAWSILNIAFTFVLWIFGAVSLWSAQNFYVDMLVTVYNSACRASGADARDNRISLASLRLDIRVLTLSPPSRAVLFTLIPPFIYAVVEHDVVEAKAELFPATFAVSQRDMLFSWREINSAIGAALCHAVLLFYAPVLALPLDREDPHGLWTAGNASFAIVVLHAHVRIFVITRHWTPLTIAGNIISVALFFAMSICYDDYDPDWIGASSIVTTASSQGSMTRVFRSTAWWLLCLLCIGALAALQIACKAAVEVFDMAGTSTLVDFIRGQSLEECRALAGTVGPARAEPDARAPAQAEKPQAVELTSVSVNVEEPEAEAKQNELAGKQRSPYGCLDTSTRDDAAEGETCGTMLCSS